MEREEEWSRCVSIDQVIKIDGSPDEYQAGEASAKLSRDELVLCKFDRAPFKDCSRLKAKDTFISKGVYIDLNLF